jgi:hypothetical protein
MQFLKLKNTSRIYAKNENSILLQSVELFVLEYMVA